MVKLDTKMWFQIYLVRSQFSLLKNLKSTRILIFLKSILYSREESLLDIINDLISKVTEKPFL